MFITDKEHTFSGYWPATKENTYYGFEREDGQYVWYKSKQSAIRNIKNKKGWIMKATLIENKMYINKQYAKVMGW